MRWPWQQKREPPPSREQVDASVARMSRHADDIMAMVQAIREEREAPR